MRERWMREREATEETVKTNEQTEKPSTRNEMQVQVKACSHVDAMVMSDCECVGLSSVLALARALRQANKEE